MKKPKKIEPGKTFRSKIVWPEGTRRKIEEAVRKFLKEQKP